VIFPSLATATAAAARLTVLDQSTFAVLPFVLNHEQREVLRLALQTRRLCVGKGRQVGCSTLFVFLMFLLCTMNAGLPCAIVADEQGKANALLGKIKRWAKMLGFHLVIDNVESIEFANGAKIDALSAISPAADGESRVGRSGSYAVLLCTEQSFWRGARAAWTALTSTMPHVVWNESTGAPGDLLFREIFEGDGWDTHFIGVQQHVNYRRDAASITDARWGELREDYGFTSRESAAWWHHKMTTDKIDASRMLREFPVQPEHMWTFREGMHINTWVEAPVLERDGDWEWFAPIFADEEGHEHFGEPCIAGVDTALGLGLDASSIALVGHRSGLVRGVWRSNTTRIIGFQRALDACVKRFAPAAVVVESNGCGAQLWQHAALTYANAYEQKSGNLAGEVFDRRDQLREAIESGAVPIGGQLLEDARGSLLKSKRTFDGRVRAIFEGRDDVLSAVSFARKWRDQNPYREQKQQHMQRQVYDIAERLKAKRSVGVTF